jgi:two-component system chemotaxis response regulator CheB
MEPHPGCVDVVAIGASAGGIEALMVLLPSLPRDYRPAVLVVLHLLRERPSLLREIFAPKCALPVRNVLDKDPVEPGTIVFAPPNYHLLVDLDGPPGEPAPQLALSTEELVNNSRPSIDVLFESVAQAYGPRAAGVILSGANADGAHGLSAIARAGGVTIVQAPPTAQSPAMPAAALKAGPVDHVLRLEQIGPLLHSLGAAEWPRSSKKAGS